MIICINCVKIGVLGVWVRVLIHQTHIRWALHMRSLFVCHFKIPLYGVADADFLTQFTKRPLQQQTWCQVPNAFRSYKYISQTSALTWDRLRRILVVIPYRTKWSIGINIREICDFQIPRKVKPTKSQFQQVLFAWTQHWRCVKCSHIRTLTTDLRISCLTSSPTLYDCAIEPPVLSLKNTEVVREPFFPGI